MDNIETKRLTICELKISDADFIIDLLNSPGWLQYIGDRGVKTTDDAHKYIVNGPQASYKKNNFGLWLVKLKESSTAIGICGLIQRDSLPNPDIGFAFLPQHEGKGYAYEAATCVMAFAETVTKLTTVSAIVTPDNLRSLALLQKLGFDNKGLIQLAGTKEELMLLEKHLIH